MNLYTARSGNIAALPAPHAGVLFTSVSGCILHSRLLPSAVLALTLAACGGGQAGSAAAATAYQFITPALGSQNTYADTQVDNLNNTLKRSIVSTVVAVNADGSYRSTSVDPSGDTVGSGTVDQTFYPTAYSLNNAGQETAQQTTRPGNVVVSCAADPHDAGPPAPLSVGQHWSFSYTPCAGAPVFTQAGVLVDTETVTVPAGTFSAYKFQSSLTWTTAGGSAVTETISHWRNASGSDSRIVKETTSYAYTGTAPPAGSPVSLSRQLVSYK